MKSRVFTIISVFALVLAMAAAGTASAQSSPAQDVYNSNGEVLDVVSGGSNTVKPAEQDHVKTNVETADTETHHTTATTTVSSGQLPFTGFQAGLVAAAGLGLLGAGFAMRRASRGGSTG